MPRIAILVLHGLHLVIVVLVLIAVVCWGTYMTLLGGGEIYYGSATYDEVFQKDPFQVLSAGLEVFLLGTAWAYVAITLLLKMLRDRNRPEQIRRRVRQGWILVVGFLIVGMLVIMSIKHEGFRMAHYTLAPPSKCELHDTVQLEDVVWVVYGLVEVENEEWDARREVFPNAMTSVDGGCYLYGTGGLFWRGPTHARVRYCPVCREQKRVWYEKHQSECERHRRILSGRFWNPNGS